MRCLEQFRFASERYGQAAVSWWVGVGLVGVQGAFGGQVLHTVPWWVANWGGRQFHCHGQQVAVPWWAGGGGRV